MKTFQGRVVTPGCAQAEALVTHGGLNTLASFQKSLQFGDKTAKCGDQNNPDLYGKPMAGKALCLPQTIGSTTGGLVLYCACAMDRQPALFFKFFCFIAVYPGITGLTVSGSKYIIQTIFDCLASGIYSRIYCAVNSLSHRLLNILGHLAVIFSRNCCVYDLFYFVSKFS